MKPCAAQLLSHLTSAFAHISSSLSVSLLPTEPVNTHFVLSPLLYILPLSITWPLRVVAMVTPPTGAGYLPCYRSNWFPTEFQACHSVSLSLVISPPLSFFLSPHMFDSVFYHRQVTDCRLNGWLAFLITVCWLFTRPMNHLCNTRPC